MNDEPFDVMYYTSAHGYGHGVRSSDILNALYAARPELKIGLVTELPEAFLRARLNDRRIAIRQAAFDVGMIQQDSVQVDVAATLEAIEQVYSRERELVVREQALLEQHRVRLVVADIPAIPMDAAKRAGIPVVAIGNFGWNWIYEPFVAQNARWRGVIERIAAGYAQADLLIRLPFAEPMQAFKRQMNAGLLAASGRNCRDEMAAVYGVDPQRRWVLLSFAALEWGSDALERIEADRETVYFAVKPLEWPGRRIYAVDRADFSFSDVLASVNMVVSKPGYGLLSECIVNEKPLVYVDRKDFVEYPILVEAIRRYIRHVHIPQQDLYAGRLAPYLVQMDNAPDPTESLPADGCETVVNALLKQLTCR